MSVARACRRFRRKIKNDSRYNRPTRRDAVAARKRDMMKWEAEKQRLHRKKG